jgi:hypothetical protein
MSEAGEKFDQVFDAERKLQYVNGEIAVLHCHHYATIFTKLALDMAFLEGPDHLRTAMEETAYLTLQRRFLVDGIHSAADREMLGKRYFSLAGLGQLEVDANENGGTATMRHSHLDEGWLKKWGTSKQPVNLIGQGYLAGFWSAMFARPVGHYKVRETESLVSGATASRFSITAK